jgi:hypothetical protein
MSSLGKLLILIGAILVVAGVILIFLPKIPFLGRLPGDIYIKKEKFVFYFPLTTSIIVSIILTVLFWIFRQR